MIPPEVILDRWVKTQSRTHPGFIGYVGKLDIEKVNPPALRALLALIQDAMNVALQSESVNASGGVEHPPFHFDYLEVKGRTQVNDPAKNAHAFQHSGFSFIAVTLPLIELLWDVSQRLSSSALVQGLLQIDPETERLKALQALLFQFQVGFLVSHEYTHHVHQHCKQDEDCIAEVWTEFSQNETNGSLDSQAQELDADGYAIYLVLANYLGGGGRQSGLLQLGRQDLPRSDADEFFLMCFFLAVAAFFCTIWPEDIKIMSIGQLSHPPVPVRIEYAIRVAKMWCDQNGSVPESWFGAERFGTLFGAAAEAVGRAERQSWDAHIAFLQSEEGKKYDRILFERFETMRRNRQESSQSAVGARA